MVRSAGVHPSRQRMGPRSPIVEENNGSEGSDKKRCSAEVSVVSARGVRGGVRECSAPIEIRRNRKESQKSSFFEVTLKRYPRRCPRQFLSFEFLYTKKCSMIGILSNVVGASTMRHTKANSLRNILGSVLSLCRARPLCTRPLCRGRRHFVFVFLTFFSQGARWTSQSTD